MLPIQQLLAELHQQYQQRIFAQHQQLPETDYIADWQSPCYVTSQLDKFNDRVGWRAVKQQPVINFDGVEEGLGEPLHDSVKQYYQSYYAGDISWQLPGGETIELLQVQGPEDAERLQRNLIAHVLMKRQLKQSSSLFIGVGEGEDLLISVDNSTGAVGFEYAGKPQHQLLAPSLAEWLSELTAS